MLFTCSGEQLSVYASLEDGFSKGSLGTSLAVRNEYSTNSLEPNPTRFEHMGIAIVWCFRGIITPGFHFGGSSMGFISVGDSPMFEDWELPDGGPMPRVGSSWGFFGWLQRRRQGKLKPSTIPKA